MRRRLALALLAALACALLPGSPLAAQCAMCRSVVTQSAEGQALGAQLNLAILVMLAAPYLVTAVVAAALLRRRIGDGLVRLARRPR
jgi:hypothetical protein